MLICPLCEAELKREDLKDGVWHCVCGEIIPKDIAVDTEVRKCGGQKCE